MDRLQRLLRAANEKIDRLRRRIDKRSEEVAKNFAAQREDKERLRKVRRELERAIGERQRFKLTAEADQLHKRIRTRRRNRLQTLARKRHLKARLRGWVDRRIRYRKRLEELREQEWPEYEGWMANGHDARVVDGVKDYVAAGVVHFGLSASSLYRATVIPQSNPNSLHGPNVRPGRAGDLVGPRHKMVAFQEWVLEHRTSPHASLNELYGPENGLCFDDGHQITVAEGSFIEDLHDSHDHVGVTPR